MTPTLRFVLCGSVDDGKSTIIGRILRDCREVFTDQMRMVEADSRRYGTQGGATDLALLMDGLQDEREQGITIDVAYRGFETPPRACGQQDGPGRLGPRSIPGNRRGLSRRLSRHRSHAGACHPGFRPDRRRRHDHLRAHARGQPQMAGIRCHPGSPRRAEAAARPLSVADGPLGVRQVHDRQPSSAPSSPNATLRAASFSPATSWRVSWMRPWRPAPGVTRKASTPGQ